MTANNNLSGRAVQQQSYLFKYLSELCIHLCRARRITVLVTYPDSDLTTLNNHIQHTFRLLVIENFSKHFCQFERIDADRSDIGRRIAARVPAATRKAIARVTRTDWCDSEVMMDLDQALFDELG